MLTYYLLVMLFIFLIVSVLGYLFIILKEKYYFSQNIILIDSKGISQEQIDEIEAKHFTLGNKEIMSGDEMKIYFDNHKIIRGIILGAKLKENTILILTPNDQIKYVFIEDIIAFKITSKYGKFFKRF